MISLGFEGYKGRLYFRQVVIFAEPPCGMCHLSKALAKRDNCVELRAMVEGRRGDADATHPGNVSTRTSLKPWSRYKDSEVTIAATEFKDLYPAFQPRKLGTENSTISVRGEAV